MLTVALALTVGLTPVLRPETDARATVTTLPAVDGPVLTSHGRADFTQAREGDVLVGGDTIRTGAVGAAEITYFDGSSLRVEAKTEIIVESLRTSAGGAVRTLGRAWHVLTRVFSGALATRCARRARQHRSAVRGLV